MQYFHVSKQTYGCQCLGSLTCTQMLMHMIAREGCVDTVRESALKVDSGRKISCVTRESNLPQWCVGPMLDQLSYIPAPIGQSTGMFLQRYEGVGWWSELHPSPNRSEYWHVPAEIWGGCGGGLCWMVFGERSLSWWWRAYLQHHSTVEGK